MSILTNEMFNMPDVIFNNIGSGRDITPLWQTIAKEIIAQRLIPNGQYFPVPYIDRVAKHFGLFNAFVKLPPDPGVLNTSTSVFRHVGNFKDMINPSPSENDFVKGCFITEESDVADIPKDFLYQTQRLEDKTGKALSLKIIGIKRQRGNLDRMKDGDVTILKVGPDMRRANKVYVVNDILQAQNVSLVTKVDNNETKWYFPGPIPIAYNLLGFSIKNGYLQTTTSKQFKPNNGDEEVLVERPSETRKP